MAGQHFALSLLALAFQCVAYDSGNIRGKEYTGKFSGTAAEVDAFDPHDDVPACYSKVRVAHAVLMSTTWLILFPIGAIIPRIVKDPGLVWLHAMIQMAGFWINAAAAGMGIWMGKQIDQLSYFHPAIGMLMLALLAIQPATEILNHCLYHKYPKMIITAHVHLWLGRSLLIAGAVQGGLGFRFAGNFHKATVDVAPRIAYGAVAIAVGVFYICVGIIYPEYVGSSKRATANGQKGAVAAES